MHDDRRHTGSQRWIAVAVVAVMTPVALYLTSRGATWIGRPFPGFFIAENRAVPTIGRYEWTGLRAGVPFHGRLDVVDGRPITGSEELYRYTESLAVGTPVRYAF